MTTTPRSRRHSHPLASSLRTILALILLLAAVAGCGGKPAQKQKNNAAQILYRRGRIASQKGDTYQALRLFRSSLETSRKAKNHQGIAASLHAIAMTRIARKEWREALERFEEVLKLDRQAVAAGIEKGESPKTISALKARIVTDLNDISRLHRKLGQPRAALRTLQEALLIDKALGRDRGAAITHNNIGKLLLAFDDLDEAEKHFKASLRLFGKLKLPAAVDTVQKNLRLLGEVRKRRKGKAP